MHSLGALHLIIVLYYLAIGELGISNLDLAKLFGIFQPMASQSGKRGEKFVKEKHLNVSG